MGLVDLIPLLFLAVFAGGFAWIGYQMYLYSQHLKTHGKASMEKRGVTMSKGGGIKVGVKNVRQDDFSDRSGNVLKKVWDASGSELPAKDGSLKAPSSGSRPSSSRSNSTQNVRPTTASRSPSTQSIPKPGSP